MNTKPLIWLITGISSGIGKAVAAAALRRGDTVIGTVRKPEQVLEFESCAPGRAFARQLDLTDTQNVVPVLTRALSALGAADVVINCAGYGLAGAAEEVSDSELRHQMETNFFGTVEVVQAALPFMRAQRRGHIFNVSSTAGVLGYPGLSLYCASKFAVEGFSEGLSVEVAHLGIKVTIVELDGFRTNWSSANAIVRAKRAIPDYEASAGQTRKGLEKFDGHQVGDPAKAAQAIIVVLNSPEPPLRLVLGAAAVTWIRDKLNGRLDELGAWESVSKDTAIGAQ
jgi:NAD(P)-dependent dehydrogenase (short-subunit alcohol dehydrogenase family)